MWSQKIPKSPFDGNVLSSPNSLIAAELLLLDIDRLVDLLIEIHPEPFALISKHEFLKKTQTLKQSIRYPLSRSDFYLRVAPLIAELGDIHSRLEFPKNLQNKKANHVNEKTQGNKLFPLAVLYENSGLYVAADLSFQPKVPTGAIITEINGAPVEFLLQVMKRMTAKETAAGQRRKIQVDFPWLLAVMGYAKSNYDISYRWQGNQLTLNVAGIEPPPDKIEFTDVSQNESIDENHDGSQQLITQSKSSISFYGFSKLTSRTALLWFNDFNEDPQIFESFLDQQFEELEAQGLTNLIIDVRYNDGGLSQNIKNLLSHLTTNSIFWAKSGEINISLPLKKLHQEKTKQRRKNKYTWGLQWLPLEWTDSLQYEISWSDSGEIVSVDFEAIEPTDSVIPTNIHVLTNGFCYSACSTFVAAINRYELAETLGEITGSFARVQYGYPLKAKLPHSQLSLVLPTLKLILDPEIDDRKAILFENNSLIVPNQPIVRSPQQIEKRRDTILNTALKQIESINMPR